MIKLIATDLDGTLLYPKRPLRLVSSKNKRLFVNFAKNGGKVTLVTARGPKFSKLIAKKLGISCNIIACCGAYIEVNNEIVQNVTINNKIIKNIIDEVNQNRKKAGFVLTTDDFLTIGKTWNTNLFEKFLLKMYKVRNGRYNEGIRFKNNEVEQFLLNENRGVYKMYIFLSDFLKGERYQMADILKSKYGNQVDIIVSRSGIEISIKNINKGNSVEKMISNTDFKKSEVAVVGDDANDIPMFELFENSFVLEHGYSKATECAKYKVKNFNEVFKIISRI